MKKCILFISFLLMGFIQTGFAQAEKFKFTCTFRFEIASYSEDCNSGLGLCFILPKFFFRTVEAGITKDSRNITFHIIRASIHHDLERELNRITQFPIREGTILPLDISRKIGFSSEAEIKPGHYPMLFDDEYITITCLVD